VNQLVAIADQMVDVAQGGDAEHFVRVGNEDVRIRWDPNLRTMDSAIDSAHATLLERIDFQRAMNPDTFDLAADDR
jgi:hypothetical protein